MKGLRAGIFLLLIFSVLAHGAVLVGPESLIEVGAAFLLVGWAILFCRDSGAKIQWSPLNWPLLGLIAIGLAQLLFRGTEYPFLTRVEILKLTTYFIVFFLMAQVFRSRADLTRLAWFLILLCFVVSLLGIILHFTSEGQIFGFQFVRTGGDPFGPFASRNIFAGFVELTLPVGLAMMVFRAIRSDVFVIAALLMIVPVGALILTGSRGGIISFAFGLAVLAVLARRQRRAEAPRLAAIGIVILAGLALIVWLGVGKAIERFSQLGPNDVSLNGRITMLRGAAHIFLDHPIQGAGLGTLVAVYPRYATSYDGRLVDHVHDDYAEGLAETGVLGGLCGIAFLWLLYQEGRKAFMAEQGHFSRAIHAGAIVALSGILLHSCMDFNLHIPSNALLFLVQAFLATSPALPSNGFSKERRHGAKIDT